MTADAGTFKVQFFTVPQGTVDMIVAGNEGGVFPAGAAVHQGLGISMKPIANPDNSISVD